ncbi:MAG: hypothetical protein ACK4MT_08970, partial [Thermaurantiacus tibetensis]
SLIRIAIFYDGSYFQQVTNYYRYSHEIGRRIDLGGLHEFVRWRAAWLEDARRLLAAEDALDRLDLLVVQAASASAAG